MKHVFSLKKVLSLLLCLTMLVALAACGDTAPADTSSATGSDVSSTQGSDTSSNTDTGSTGTSSGTQEDVLLFDETMEHKVIVTDIANHSIIVLDLDACEGDYTYLTDDATAVVWEWDADNDVNCKLRGSVGAGIDAAKYRYSAYYEKDVIIACSSGGWAGVIDYEAKTVLWEYNIGEGPHSIEMLPNGDVVVACSSDPGALKYIPLSAGITKPVHSIHSLYCHGVSWDPENECLWVLEDTGVYSVLVENMGTAEGKLVRLSKTLFANGEGGGHAFSPVYGEPGNYWASSGSALWKFDSSEETLTKNYPRSSTLTHKSNIKGIASFPDGTVVETVANLCGDSTYDWSSDGLRVITREMSGGKVSVPKEVVKVIKFDTSHREFYKIQPFTKDYQ